MAQVSSVLNNNNNNNNSGGVDDDKMCVYDLWYGCDLNEMKRRFRASSNKSITLKNIKLCLYPHDVNQPEEHQKKERERIDNSKDMLEIINVFRPGIKNLVLENVHASESRLLTRLFMSLGILEIYPNLTSLTLDFCLLPRVTFMALVDALNPLHSRLKHLSISGGNFKQMDMGFSDEQTVQWALMHAIIRNMTLRTVHLRVGNIREAVFVSLWRCRAMEIANDINELLIDSCPNVKCTNFFGFPWLRCFPLLNTLRLRRCRITYNSLRNIRWQAINEMRALTTLDIVDNSARSMYLTSKTDMAKPIVAAASFLLVADIPSVTDFLMTIDLNDTRPVEFRKIIGILDQHPTLKLNGKPASYYRDILARRPRGGFK